MADKMDGCIGKTVEYEYSCLRKNVIKAFMGHRCGVGCIICWLVGHVLRDVSPRPRNTGSVDTQRKSLGEDCGVSLKLGRLKGPIYLFREVLAEGSVTPSSY